MQDTIKEYGKVQSKEEKSQNAIKMLDEKEEKNRDNAVKSSKQEELTIKSDAHIQQTKSVEQVIPIITHANMTFEEVSVQVQKKSQGKQVNIVPEAPRSLISFAK